MHGRRGIVTSPNPADDPLLGRAELQDRALRGASWTLLHTVISLPVAFLANLVLARLLGVADYGRLAFLTLLIGVASGIVEVGVNAGLTQFGSRAHASGRVADVQRMLSAAQGFRLLVVAPLTTLLVLAVADVEPRLMVTAIVFGVWVPAALNGALFCIVIENKTATAAKLALVTGIVVQLAVVTAAWITRSPDVVWLIRLIVSGVAIILFLAPISPSYRKAVLRPTLPRGFPPGFWAFALPAGAAGLLGTLALSRTEVFFLTWLSTPEAVGLFALAHGLAAHVFAPADALIGPLIPAVAGLHVNDRDALLPAFERVVRASSTVISVVCGVALPAFAVLVPTFYGQDFSAAAPLLVALGIAGAALAAGGPVLAFTMGRLSSGRMLAANATALAIDVGLAMALIPVLGVWGAVIANLAGALSRLVLLIRAEIAALGLGWLRLANQALPALLAMPIAAACWLVGDGVTSLPAVPTALVVGIIGLAALVVGLRTTRSGLTERDRQVVLNTVPRGLAPATAVLLRFLTHR